MRRSNQSVCCFSKVDGVILFRTLQNKNRSRKKVFIFIFHVTTKSTYDTNAWTHKVKCGSKREKKRVNDSYLNEMQTKSIYFVNHTCWRQQIHTHYSSSCRTAQRSAAQCKSFPMHEFIPLEFESLRNTYVIFIHYIIVWPSGFLID